MNFPFDTPVHARFFNVTETHLFSPTLVNEFRFGFVHINDVLSNVPPVTATDLGIDRPTNSVTNSIYKFIFESSGFEIGPAPFGNQSQDQNNINFVDTVSWVKGHACLPIRRRVHACESEQGLSPGVQRRALLHQYTGGPDVPGVRRPISRTFFWERRNSASVAAAFPTTNTAPTTSRYLRRTIGRSVTTLTLNLGLRTEIFGAFHDDLCHIGNLDPALANAGEFPFIYPSCVNNLNLTGLTGDAQRARHSTTTTRRALGPRIGLAYDVCGHHNTTVRAGYGIYYVREDVGTADQLSFETPFLPVAFGGGSPGCLGTYFSATPLAGCPSPNPNALPQAGTLDPNFVPCLNVFQGFPGGDTTQSANYGTAGGNGCPGPLQTLGIFGLAEPRHFVVPSTQQWNLSVQRALGKQWVLEVAYVGTHSVHLRETRDALQSQDATPTNPVVVGGESITTNTFDNAIARSRAQGINGYSGFQLFANDAYSHYNSLQTTLSRRWGAGYFQAAYTFSRSTDATSSGNTAFNTAFNDESTLAASRGLSDFDRTHRLAVSYRYDLPFFSHSEGLTRKLLAGWAVSGITIVQSGLPFSVLDSGAGTAFLGSGSAPGVLSASLAPGETLGDGLSSGDIGSRINGYLNPAAFTPAPLLYPTECNPNQPNPAVLPNANFCTTGFGNLGRNTFRGPGQQNWDFSLIKNFKITERQSLRFTTDFFNIWNHANFGNPAVTDVESISLPNSPFGKITSDLGTPRLIQFSLRYMF